MDNNSHIEIEKFNGWNFELWNLKIEYILVDREKWVVFIPKTTRIGISLKDWKKT